MALRVGRHTLHNPPSPWPVFLGIWLGLGGLLLAFWVGRTFTTIEGAAASSTVIETSESTSLGPVPASPTTQRTTSATVGTASTIDLSAPAAPSSSRPASLAGDSVSGAASVSREATPPVWAADEPSSDYVEPVNGWGVHETSCPDDSFLVYGARTSPRKYEYTLCSFPDGRLVYHGIDVDSGAQIRLDACVDDGRYVAWASRDYRYEVVDGRPEPWEREGGPNQPRIMRSPSRITLYKSATEIAWQYDVESEWGMQNLPTEFANC